MVRVDDEYDPYYLPPQPQYIYRERRAAFPQEEQGQQLRGQPLIREPIPVDNRRAGPPPPAPVFEIPAELRQAPDAIASGSNAYARSTPHGPDYVDYGAYTGGYGAFGWYSDHPVHVFHHH